MAGSPFSKEQQRTLYQIAQNARDPDVPFEDQAGKFMEEALTTEEQQQVPDFQGQPEGLVKERGKYNAEKHIASLRENRYIDMANDLSDTRLKLDQQATQLKDENQMLQLKTLRSGIQMMQSGAVDMGRSMVNTVLPEGQRILRIEQLGKNKARVFSENVPDGEVIDIDQLITSITSSETQFKEREASRRLKISQDKEEKLGPNQYRLKDGSVTTEPVMRAQYKQTYQLLDDIDLRIMAGTNPSMYQIEKAKRDSAPEFRTWAKQAYDVDLRGGSGPKIPEGVRGSVYHTEKAAGAPEEALSLQKGQTVVKDNIMYRRNSNGILEKRKLN